MKQNFGLQELQPDSRDFALGAVLKLPALANLPLTFSLPFIVKNQGNTDYCTAYASTAVSYVQEGIDLHPSYNFAHSKYLQGDIDSWGCDLRTAMKSHVVAGALPTDQAPDSTDRDWEFWKKHQFTAFPQRKKSYFAVTGPHDHFDNIRATIFATKTPVAIGLQFGYKLEDIIFSEITSGYGHAMTAIGFGNNYITLGNSYGIEAGENGKHLITREVINHWVERYGAFTLTDISKEDAQYHLEYGFKFGDSWLTKLFKMLWNMLR